MKDISLSVILSKEEYDQLLNDQYKLRCLEACGVDNWCGYSDAIEMFKEENNE